jgi:proteasome lid subunit RPN8/RPN11
MSVVTLRLPTALNERMNAHLRAAYPEEGCGLMLGRETPGVREVVRVMAFENQREDTRERRYLIAPEQFLAGEKAAREAGLDVLGIFHSHPDHPCRPSAFDLEHAWPYYSYVIVSVERGSVAGARSWRLREDRSGFDEETIELAPPDRPEEEGT